MSTGTSKMEAINTSLAIRKEILDTLRQNLHQAKQSIKIKANAHKQTRVLEWRVSFL